MRVAIAREIPPSRRHWAGLHTTAEDVIAGLDTAPEVVCMTSGAWSVIKLLALALARVGRPASLDCWTWTVSRRAIERLWAWHVEGVRVRVAVDASLWRRQPAYGRALVAGLGDAMRAGSIHAKVARVSGPHGAIFVGGSGNLNLCRRAELLFLSADPRLSAWLSDLTDTLFAAVPAGAPKESDADLHDRLSAAFPPVPSGPSWAAGLPTLRGTR
jgi:hypothetical protein